MTSGQVEIKLKSNHCTIDRRWQSHLNKPIIYSYVRVITRAWWCQQYVRVLLLNVTHWERTSVPTDLDFWPIKCLYFYFNLLPTVALKAFIPAWTSVTILSLLSKMYYMWWLYLNFCKSGNKTLVLLPSSPTVYHTSVFTVFPLFAFILCICRDCMIGLITWENRTT